MAYVPTNWTDGSGEPISADNLNHIETGISDAHTRIDDLDSSLESLNSIVATKTIDSDFTLVSDTHTLATVQPGTYYGGSNSKYTIKKAGYRCLGIVGFNFNGTGASYQNVYAITPTDYGTPGSVSIFYECRNNYSKAYSGQLLTRTLWVKDR